FQKIFDVVDAFKMPQFMIEGYEAADIIGTIARRMEGEGYDIVIVTEDKDFSQLVSDRITLLDTMKNKTTRVADVVEKYGVPPEKVLDIFALMGDAIDNIPGIKGIGEKTAISLIKTYGSLEALLAIPEGQPESW